MGVRLGGEGRRAEIAARKRSASVFAAEAYFGKDSAILEMRKSIRLGSSTLFARATVPAADALPISVETAGGEFPARRAS
jgi:hypothetical protein